MTDSQQSYLTDQQLLDSAFEIFLQLAADNLTPQHITCFNQQFEQYGYLALYTPEEDWRNHLEIEQLDDYVEIMIGLSKAPDIIDPLLARVLISRLAHEKSNCMILWNGE